MSARTRGVAVAVKAPTGGRAAGGDGIAETPVVGTEVVAPARDAVRLVDDETIDRQPAEAVEEARRAEAFRCEVEEAQLAGRRPLAATRHGSRPTTWLCRHAAGTPSSLRRATWSTISAMSGETTMVRPPPAMPGTQ